MMELWDDLERVEREILVTAIDDAARLGGLMGERGRLIVTLERQLRGMGDAASYDRLLGHYAAGQALGDRLRQERARVVEATRGKGAARMVAELG